MNLPTQQPQNLPLRRAATDDISRPLGKLVLAFDPYVDRSASHAKEYAQAKIAVYREALDGLPEWAIERAVSAVISGRAEGQNLDRFPTSARLAAEAQRHCDEEGRTQARARRVEQQLREQREREQWERSLPPAEERARRAEEIMRNAGLAPREQPPAVEFDWSKVHSRFAPALTEQHATAEVETTRARYGMTPEALALVPAATHAQRRTAEA